jgi:hypothetical protein
MLGIAMTALTELMLTIVPPPASTHRPTDRLPDQKRALQVDVEDGGPVRFGDVEKVGGLEDAGVVDERIDGAERLAGRGERGVDLVLATDVAMAVDDARAVGLELLRKGVPELVVDIPDRDRGPVLREPLGAGRADALCTAGDHGDRFSR